MVLPGFAILLDLWYYDYAIILGKWVLCMIAHFTPACTIPRTDFRSRRRAGLIAPVSAVFELRDSTDSSASQDSRFLFQGRERLAELDVVQLQAKAAYSRLCFDTVFQSALQDIEPDGQALEKGGDEFDL